MKLASSTLSHALAVGWDTPAVRRERRVVEELARAAGAEFDETLEGREIADVADRPDVALDIGGDVSAQPVARVELPVEDARIAAREEGLFQRVRVAFEAKDLASREREQMEHRAPPRKRLADRVQQRKVLRPGQDPAPGLGVGVDEALQVRRQVRRALHLVDDCPFRELGEEAARVLGCECPYVGRFQVREGEVRKDRAAERGLAALAGARERDRRELPGGPAEPGGEVSVESSSRGVYRGDPADSKSDFQSAGSARDEDASRGTSGG